MNVAAKGRLQEDVRAAFLLRGQAAPVGRMGWLIAFLDFQVGIEVPRQLGIGVAQFPGTGLAQLLSQLRDLCRFESSLRTGQEQAVASARAVDLAFAER